MNETVTLSNSAVMPVFNRNPIAMARGEGMYVWDTDGKKYLDFLAGIGVSSLGHRHPHLVETLRTQAEVMWHGSNLYRGEEMERLAHRLTETSFAESCFFCNSGSEAVEAMIKLARRYHAVGGAPERWRIVTLAGAFHGRTVTTIAAANNAKYLDGFGPRADGFDNVPFGDLDAVRAAITPETAGLMLEPIQGEGGIRPVDLDYLRGLRELADEHGILLLLDEVQCGNARTGKMWAHEWAGISPDALATAKGLGGGFPVGALMATQEAARGLTPGSHGTTYGGNPMAMAVANAVLDILMTPDFLANVDARGRQLWVGLEEIVADHPHVFESHRGAGLMQGLVCAPEVSNADMLASLRDAGLLTAGAAFNVIRLLPPLIAEDHHVDEALTIIQTCAAQFSAD